MHLVYVWPSEELYLRSVSLKKKRKQYSPCYIISVCVLVQHLPVDSSDGRVSLCAGRHWKDVSHLVHR